MTLAVDTARLHLLPLTPEAVDALLAGNGDQLTLLTGAVFPTPVTPPPLMEDALPFMRDRLRANPGELGWWAWLVVRRDTRQVLGSAGFGGQPNGEGALVMGYATYPSFEGHGYASEAVKALIDWAFTQDGVRKVCATIPPWNTGSRRVAEKVGMRQVGTIWEEDVDEVELWAVDRYPERA